MKQTHGLNVPEKLEELCHPRTMALLIYDMQVGIRSQIKGGDEIVARVSRALTAARKAGMRVVYTRHVSMPKSWMGVTQYRTAMAWQRKEEPDAVTPWFLRDAPPAAIVPELAPTADDAIFDKLAMSAFEGTPLRYALRDCGILSLAIAGIALEIGIEPTARHATDVGIIPVVLADACGVGNQEAGEGALASMRFIGEAIISEVDTFCRLLDSPG